MDDENFADIDGEFGEHESVEVGQPKQSDDEQRGDYCLVDDYDDGVLPTPGVPVAKIIDNAHLCITIHKNYLKYDRLLRETG